MNKLILTLAVFALSLQAGNAQWWTGNKKVNGNGDMTSEQRQVADYDLIALEGSMDVELTAGNEGNLKVEAESNLLKHIVTEVSGNKLKISVEKDIILNPSSRHAIRITVPVEDIHSVDLTGSGNIHSRERISSENMKVKLTGSGDISLELRASNVQSTLTGSGDINLRGSTSNLDCTVAGSGDFGAYGLKAENVKASISGSGEIQVSVSGELVSRITGSGDLTYRGNPQKEDFRTAGSGSVSKR